MWYGDMNRIRDNLSLLDTLTHERRSIRKYKPDKPPAEWIDRMILCAIRAPSPSNSQPVRFIRIASEQKKDDLHKAMAAGRKDFLKALGDVSESGSLRKWINAYYGFSEFIFNAPLLFAVGTITPTSGFSVKLVEAGILKTYNTRDSGLDIALGLSLKGFLLKARELGLGTCVLTAPLIFVSDINQTLGIDDVQIKCLVTAGFPDENPRMSRRKSVKDVYHEI